MTDQIFTEMQSDDFEKRQALILPWIMYQISAGSGNGQGLV